MTTVLLTLLLFGGAMLLMAVGLLAGKALRGSCGGVAGSCACSEAEAAGCERRKAPSISGRLGSP